MARRALMLRLTDLRCSDHSFRQSGNCVRQTQRRSISRWPIQSLSIRRTGPICLLRSRLLQYCITLYSIVSLYNTYECHLHLLESAASSLLRSFTLQDSTLLESERTEQQVSEIQYNTYRFQYAACDMN